MTTNHDERRATRESSRVALVTCAAIPDLESDDRLLLEPLRAAGLEVDVLVWDAHGITWRPYDLVVIRSTWDYATRRHDFLAWTRRVPALANPADVVKWNTDKRYLLALQAARVPIVPTTLAEPGRSWQVRAGTVVVKPLVGAGSLDAGRYGDGEDEAMFAHVAGLHAAGRTVLLQPYYAGVETAGETALVYIGGPGGLTYSHAVRKGPMLTGPATEIEGLYKQEAIEPRTASAAEREVGERALAAVPGGADRLLYARVDLIPDDRGNPVVLELELTEPSMFLGYAEGAAARFAGAIAARATAGSARP